MCVRTERLSKSYVTTHHIRRQVWGVCVLGQRDSVRVRSPLTTLGGRFGVCVLGQRDSVRVRSPLTTLGGRFGVCVC